MAFHLGNRSRLALRYLGVALATFVVFVFAIQLTFPYDRVKTKIVDGLSEKYDVTVGDVERSWIPGRFALKALSLRTRPTKSDDSVTTFFIERLEVDLHFLPALHGTAAIGLDAKIGAGHITGTVSVGKSGTSIHVDGNDLPGASLPMKEALGLPMSGKVDFAVALDLPNETNKAGKRGPDWSLAEGEIELSCPSGCSIGDGKTRLKPKLKNPRPGTSTEGILFGKVDIQSLFAEISITPGPGDGKPGKLELKRFDVKSTDGDLKVDFMMTLMPDINESPVAGCLRFKGSPALEKREPKTYTELQLTGAQIGPDGLFHIKLTDKFREIRRLPQTCGPENSQNMDSPGGPPPPTTGITRRPNLTVTPPEVPKPAVVPVPVTVPVPTVTIPPPATPSVPVQMGSSAAAGSQGPGGSAEGESSPPATPESPTGAFAPPPPSAPGP